MRRGRGRRNYGLDDFGPRSKFVCEWVVFLQCGRWYVSTIRKRGPDGSSIESAHINVLVQDNTTFDLASEAPCQTFTASRIEIQRLSRIGIVHVEGH